MSNMNVKIPIIVVVGPTASGKTSLAIEIAKEYNGEVVSADSMQIYKGFPIACAAPTAAEKVQAVHHLVEFLEPTVKFSVADYVTLAGETIRDIFNRGKVPIIVGGTGLYINSLVDGIVFSEQKTNIKLREELEEMFDRLGGEEMLRQLAEFDSQTAQRLNVGDRRRIIRAFEVFRLSGITFSQQNKLSKEKESPYNPVMIGITYNNREMLYERINKRVDLMLENGLLEEARSFSQKGITAAQAIGHKELVPYFNGEVSLEEAVETLKRETRRYAKRQLTWFRRDERIVWIYADSDNVYEKAKEIINKKVIIDV